MNYLDIILRNYPAYVITRAVNPEIYEDLSWSVFNPTGPIPKMELDAAIAEAISSGALGTTGTYSLVSVDKLGRVIAGSRPTTLAGNGITDGITTSMVGTPGGVASLDSAGLIPTAQLPSYVDDVLEFNSLSVFPLSGSSGKIYLSTDTNKVYRWSGSVYIHIASSDGLVANAGGTPSLQQGQLVGRPNAGVPGRLFLGTDTYSIYRDTGMDWVSAIVGGTGAASEGTLGQVLLSDGPSAPPKWTTVNFGPAPIYTATTTATGLYALAGNTSGYNNTATGTYSLAGNTSGYYNTASGDHSLFSNTTGYYNTATGTTALYANTTGFDNTGIGHDALYSNTTGLANTALGFGSLFTNSTGYYNTACGQDALYSNTVGYFNAAIGRNALYSNTVGYFNVGLGYNSLSANISFYNCVGVGANSQITAGNQVQLGDSSTTTYVYGTVQNRSDLRDKAQVRDTLLGLAFINALRPVDFKWDMREDYAPSQPIKPDSSAPQEERNAYSAALTLWLDKRRQNNLVHDGSRIRRRYHHGLIAQDILNFRTRTGIDFGGLQDHSRSGGMDVLSLGYDEFIGPIIKAIQEVSTKIVDLRDDAAVYGLRLLNGMPAYKEPVGDVVTSSASSAYVFSASSLSESSVIAPRGMMNPMGYMMPRPALVRCLTVQTTQHPGSDVTFTLHIDGVAHGTSYVSAAGTLGAVFHTSIPISEGSEIEMFAITMDTVAHVMSTVEVSWRD